MRSEANPDQVEITSKTVDFILCLLVRQDTPAKESLPQALARRRGHAVPLFSAEIFFEVLLSK